MYSVYQHWDPLKVCIVGRSYPPEFYSYIKNSKIRSVFEKIATETEEDFQKLIKLLESFGVEVVRPTIRDREHYFRDNKYAPPPMTPCDWTVMIGKTFYHNWADPVLLYQDISAADWPLVKQAVDIEYLPEYIKDELRIAESNVFLPGNDYQHIINNIKLTNKTVQRPFDDRTGAINRACITRVGKDLYFGTASYGDDVNKLKKKYSEYFTDYRCHVINTGGHVDSTYCPVVPGLIISLRDVPTYKDTFPGWEVVYLPGQSWDKIEPFLLLKDKNAGKWWVPGEEFNIEFTDFVEQWMSHWVGYVEETVFDVNMLVIDEKNVVVNNYNKEVFDAFNRHGITPHVINFRHRYFWDGGWHCLTSDIHREGTMKDYFPERNQ